MELLNTMLSTANMIPVPIPVIVVFLAVSVCLHVFVALCRERRPQVHDVEPAKPNQPPTMRSRKPYFSNTLSLVLNPKAFMLQVGQLISTHTPFKAPLVFGDVYVIRGPAALSTLFKESVHSSSTELHEAFFRIIIGMPKRATSLYIKDNSGFLVKPHSDSEVESHNRIDHITHEVLKDFLLSARAKSIAPSYAALMDTRFANLEVGPEPAHHSDLLNLLEMEMLQTNLDMIYGAELRRIHPRFCEDFWTFSHNLNGFHHPLVRWKYPDAWAARRRLLDALKQWVWIMSRPETSRALDRSAVSPAYWSPMQVKAWQEKFLAMDGFDEDAVASLYLGIIWVSNYNFIIAVFWMLLEVYKDRDLLCRVRASLSQTSSNLDVLNPAEYPLIHSVYSETLRLRTAAYITRRFPHKSVVLDGKWVIPKDKLCIASSHPAHRDENVWNTQNGKFDLDTFWAERFLVYPDDAQSGPANPTYRTWEKSHKPSISSASGSPHFSLDGVASTWIPFGGGPRACPGKHIAKSQILSTFASFVQKFDVEVLAAAEDWTMDERSYGPGVQLPVGKTPVWIRRV